MSKISTAVGLLLILCLFQVNCQTSPDPVTTCGAGSSVCPTEKNTELSEEPGTPDFSTVSSAVTTIMPVITTSSLRNVTQIDPELSTPKQPKASSTTPPPASFPKQPNPNQDEVLGYGHAGACTCDLTAYSCDINCCCDPDCTSNNRAVFSACQTQGYPAYDNRYCYATKLIFLNNSEYTLQQTQNSAFCIVRSNLAASVVYPSCLTLVSYQDFSKQWQQTHSLIWPIASIPKSISSDKSTPYTAGATMLVLINNRVQSLDLPSAGLTSACTAKERVQYLQPWSKKCFSKAPATEAECDFVSSNIYKQLNFVVRSPLLVNYTQLLSRKILSCPSDVCTPATYFICPDVETENVHFCKNSSEGSIKSGLDSGMCYGVVKKLKLILYHNGTEGLSHLNAFLWLSNVSLAQTYETLHQTISVEFKWEVSNETRNEVPLNIPASASQDSSSKVHRSPFLRSGNPGYIIGKPVLAGFRTKPKSMLNDSRDLPTETQNSRLKHDAIQLSNDSSQWLTLPAVDSEGKCDWSQTQREVVTFGEDWLTSCSVVLFPTNVSSHFSCNSLREKMLQLLLGDTSYTVFNSSYMSDWGRFIGAFGNANVSLAQDWVPFLLDDQTPSILLPVTPNSASQKDTTSFTTDHPIQTCESVPFGVEVRILHGFAGPTSNPQSKIVGASLRFSPLLDIGRSCSTGLCFREDEARNFRVVSSVQFVDVSSPAVTRFAEPPAIHIRLPPDFFYPFMATENSSCLSVHSLPLSLCLSLGIWLISFFALQCS